MRSVWSLCAGISIWALTACGGGGGGSPTVPAATTVSGYVVEGTVAGASVTLESVDASGSRVMLGQTTSGSDGAYAFQVVPPFGAVLLVTATHGSYVDDATNATVALSAPLRAFDTWSGSPRRVSLSPFSEVAVRFVERASTPSWTAETIAAANARVAEWLGQTALLDFRPANLRTSFDAAAFSELDLNLSLFAGAFSTFAQRLDANAGSKLANGLESLYQLVLVDPHDDRSWPAFVGGLSDFVDLSSLTADAKRAAKSALLFGSQTPLNDADLARGLPRGVSSGASTAAMPDDGFQLLGFHGAHTVFNKRGALIGYTSSADTPDWQVAYTASVAEMFGDGDVGIGRWNGGAIVSTTRSDNTFSSAITFLPYDSFHYAVAAEPRDLPGCGTRRLALLANTEPTLSSESIGLTRQILGLTPDSTVALEYLGGTYLGADIGARMPDGSIVRYRTPGGIDAPWMGARPVSEGEEALEPVPSSSGATIYPSMSYVAKVSGSGGGKLAMHLKVAPLNDPTEVAAVFIAPDGVPGPAGCAVAGSPGPGISASPANGEQFVFMTADGGSLYLGAPLNATFGTSGELTSVLSAFNLSGPAYDLAGNADASIGRINVTRKNSEPGPSRSLPYAVVRPGATVPTTGTVVYDLVASTAVTVDRGGSGAEVAPGQVNSATLEIVYGQYPVGTPSRFYSTARLHVTGTIGGFPFVVTGDPTHPATPLDQRGDDVRFGDFSFHGAVSAPDGGYAAVEFYSSVGSVPAIGTLLFKRR